MASKENRAARARANAVGGGFQRDAGCHYNSQNYLDLQAFPEIVRVLLGDPNKAHSTKTDKRYGAKGSLSVDIAKRTFFDHSAGKGGGALDLMVHLDYAKSRAEAVKFLQSQGWLNAIPVKRESEAERQNREQIEAAEIARKQSCAKWIWEAAEPLQGSLAWTYLTQARAIPKAALCDVMTLRFHPACYLSPYNGLGAKHPAMVAQVLNATGDMIGVHVTYLAPDGLGKADLLLSRKMIGAGFSGACVRLGSGPHVIVAEGIESALSAGSAFGLPPIAALSAGGVRSWQAIEGVKAVTIAPDMDASGVGTLAASRLADRLHGEGMKVQGFAIPPDGSNDWNDYAKAVQS
jgi:Toprim domain